MRKSLTINGVSIGYWERKGDGPCVVCCHGNSSSGDSFIGLIERLGPEVRGLAIDFYGHGATAMPATDVCDVAGYSALIVAFVRQLDLGPYLLVGHSLGGHAVIEAIPNLPPGLMSAVCLSAPPFNMETVVTVFRDPTEGLIFSEHLSSSETTRIADTFVKLDNLSVGEYEAVTQRIRAAAGAVRKAIGASLARGAFQDEVDICRRSSVPLLFIQGTEDPFIDIDCYKSLPGRERHQTVFIEGVRHSPHLEAIEEVASRVDALAGRARERQLK